VLDKFTVLKWSVLAHQYMIKSAVMWLHMLVVSLLVCKCRTVREYTESGNALIGYKP